MSWLVAPSTVPVDPPGQGVQAVLLPLRVSLLNVPACKAPHGPCCSNMYYMVVPLEVSDNPVSNSTALVLQGIVYCIHYGIQCQWHFSWT